MMFKRHIRPAGALGITYTRAWNFAAMKAKHIAMTTVTMCDVSFYSFGSQNTRRLLC